MTKEELLNLKIGNYKLTDEIYNYSLRVILTNEGSKMFTLSEFGSPVFSANINFFEKTEFCEDEQKNVSYLSAMSGVCGIKIFADTGMYSCLKPLKLI